MKTHNKYARILLAGLLSLGFGAIHAQELKTPPGAHGNIPPPPLNPPVGSLENLPEGTLPASLPDYYPKTFPEVGLIQQIDRGGNLIVINAMTRRYGGTTKVYSPTSKNEVTQVLRTGMLVGYRLTHEEINKVPFLESVWIIPLQTKSNDK